MAAKFDLIEDVNQKFNDTIVMYDKKAVVVKGVNVNIQQQYTLSVIGYTNRDYVSVNLIDPALNYRDFQIGYANSGGFSSWWFRRPHKQWAQGLKSNQMGCRDSIKNLHKEGFGFSKPIVAMLEGDYPTVEFVKERLIDKKAKAMAFHRDFALSYDEIHDDFVLEYHGMKIGASLDRGLKQFKIVSNARHLMEALREARDANA